MVLRLRDSRDSKVHETPRLPTPLRNTLAKNCQLLGYCKVYVDWSFIHSSYALSATLCSQRLLWKLSDMSCYSPFIDRRQQRTCILAQVYCASIELNWFSPHDDVTHQFIIKIEQLKNCLSVIFFILSVVDFGIKRKNLCNFVSVQAWVLGILSINQVSAVCALH